ncbi:hypothetical protein CRUP_008237, partial [Coryphaenoides rupestris]
MVPLVVVVVVVVVLLPPGTKQYIKTLDVEDDNVRSVDVLLFLSVAVESNVLFYLHDALAQLLEHREEYTQFGVVRYFAEYSVRNSNHVLFREYNYIKATPHNRASFIKAIYQDLLFGKNPNTVIVPPSLLVTEDNSTQELQEGVEASTLAECINGLCDRFKHSHPSRTCMLEVLEQSPKATYYGFLMSLAKQDAVNTDIAYPRSRPARAAPAAAAVPGAYGRSPRRPPRAAASTTAGRWRLEVLHRPPCGTVGPRITSPGVLPW